MRIKTVLSTVGAILVLVLLLFVHPWRTRENDIGTGYLRARDLPQQRMPVETGNIGENRVWTSPIDGREMRWIQPGSFMMGSPDYERRLGDSEAPGLWRDTMAEDEDRNSVDIERGFWLDVTEVTNEAYMKFVSANPQWMKERAVRQVAKKWYLRDWEYGTFPPGKAACPIDNVSWYAAKAYCEWAGKRLPTEAEWEYAARAGTSTPYWWGDTFDSERANKNDIGTLPVGMLSHRNAWGLYDMLGNASEWTSSLYKPYPYRSDDGRENPTTNDRRSLRGGSWGPGHHPKLLRSAKRYAVDPDVCCSGFRCAR